MRFGIDRSVRCAKELVASYFQTKHPSMLCRWHLILIFSTENATKHVTMVSDWLLLIF